MNPRFRRTDHSFNGGSKLTALLMEADYRGTRKGTGFQGNKGSISISSGPRIPRLYKP